MLPGLVVALLLGVVFRERRDAAPLLTARLVLVLGLLVQVPLLTGPRPSPTFGQTVPHVLFEVGAGLCALAAFFLSARPDRVT
jgi:hypothetical protein